MVKWFIGKVSSEEFKNEVSVFAELGVRVDIFENQTLVQPSDKLVEEKVGHVGGDVITGQCFLLDESSYFQIVVTTDPVIEHQQPHPHVFKRVDSSGDVKCVVLFDEIIENFSSVPDSFCEMTCEAFEGIVHVEECGPKGFEFFAVFVLMLMQITF